MSISIELVESFIGLFIVAIFINIVFLIKTSVDVWEEVFNPINIYQEHEVNWFGCILLTLLHNILLFLPSFCYWFYKLCTIGRKDK